MDSCHLPVASCKGPTAGLFVRAYLKFAYPGSAARPNLAGPLRAPSSPRPPELFRRERSGQLFHVIAGCYNASHSCNVSEKIDAIVLSRKRHSVYWYDQHPNTSLRSHLCPLRISSSMPFHAICAGMRSRMKATTRGLVG